MLSLDCYNGGGIMRKKRFIPAVALFCILCGCGGEGKEAPAEPALNENGKEEIQFADSSFSAVFKEIIVDYNKQSNRYEIIPVEFNGDLSFDDQRDRMQVEITGGKGPDILSNYVFQNFDMRPLAEAGALTDVTDFLAGQEGLCEKVVEINRVNGRLYGVPYLFSLDGMVTSEKWAADREDWTMEYCTQKMKESGCSVFIAAPGGWNRETAGLQVLHSLGVGQDGIQLFVDREKGISSFEQQEFIDLLEFSKRYADPVTRESERYRVAEGECFCSYGEIFSFKSFWYLTELCEGEPAYVGFPGPEGGVYSLSAKSAYINEASNHKEGALDFLKYLLSEEVQRKLTTENEGFAVKQNLLEDMWKEAKKEILDENTGYEMNGIFYIPRVMTDEEETIFWQMLENAVYSYSAGENDIWDIVWNEASPFFYGEKSAEETAQVIDNRVQIYLNERK